MDSRERRERAAEEAAEWLLRLSEPAASRTERTEYVRWLRESPLHVAAMLRIEQVNRNLAEFPHWRQIPPADPNTLAAQVYELPPARANRGASHDTLSTRPARRTRAWQPAVAVSLAILAATAAAILTFLAHPNTIVAEAGQRREAKLPDGTVVDLGPRSTLTIHYGPRERKVLLSAGGGALFKVAKDPTKPFIVQTGGTRVRAVGTVFGVEHDDSKVVVTVQEGRVAVTDLPEPASIATLQPIPITEISLGPNQQIVVPNKGPMGTLRKVDSQRELAWAQGRLIFDNESVGEVVRRFNRFNGVQLQVTDPQLAARPVSAVFDATDPDAFIIFLESVANVRITRESDTQVLITSEGPH